MITKYVLIQYTACVRTNIQKTHVTLEGQKKALWPLINIFQILKSGIPEGMKKWHIILFQPQL